MTKLAILFFKDDMTELCELISIIEPQTTLQNKQTTAQSYWTMFMKSRLQLNFPHPCSGRTCVMDDPKAVKIFYKAEKSWLSLKNFANLHHQSH